MNLGKKLKDLREERKLSQTELSKQLNISQKSLSNYELDQREMDYETLKRISDFFSVSIDWLLGKSEYRNEEELLEQAYFNKLKTKYDATEKDIALALDFIKRAKQK
ncbi:MAG: helix-turn-helix domain-containing protein [Clostridia bacterium]|nr:helix-turn-helix domain-containing protein [Clostridia bacterium]